MSRTQAESIVGDRLGIEGDSGWSACGYAPSDSLPPGVRMMVEDGSIARFDVDSGRTATAEGARIGDSEDRIRQLYSGRVVTTPHKYTAGHYLTVRPKAGDDTLFRIVFETDSGRVKLYRAGRLPAVAYVEGCG